MSKTIIYISHQILCPPFGTAGTCQYRAIGASATGVSQLPWRRWPDSSQSDSVCHHQDLPFCPLICPRSGMVSFPSVCQVVSSFCMLSNVASQIIAFVSVLVSCYQCQCCYCPIHSDYCSVCRCHPRNGQHVWLGPRRA